MKNKQISLIFFLVMQLYIYIMLICFNNLISIKITSFISTLLCFLMGLFLFCKTRDYYIMIISLVFTLIGDIFFIFFKSLSFIGLICLNITEILYFIRIYVTSDFKKVNIISRFIAIPLLIILEYLILKERVTISAILWMIFIINLFINILFTIKEIGLNNFFPIGLLLLLFYGISIMFVSLNDYITINIRELDLLSNLPFDLKTVFYLPANVVLTCSIFTVNRRCYSKIKSEEN